MKLTNLCAALMLVSPLALADVDALGIRSDYRPEAPINQGVPYFNGRPYPELQNERFAGTYEDQVQITDSGVDRNYMVEILEESFFFPHDSAQLSSVQMRKLNELADTLERDGTIEGLRVVGFASAVGDSSYNRDLSQRRADAVADYLRAKGVNLTVESKGLGELTSLRASDARRVDMSVESNLYSE